MKSVVLTPYSPWPADTGAKVEMQKHLQVLRSLGQCMIVSAAGWPVGAGWTAAVRRKVEQMGFTVRLREDTHPARTWRQRCGIAYAAVCKTLRMERAFGHGNLYHRHAFPVDWWQDCIRDADLAVINYSYWGGLPTDIPKAIILHDLLSDIMYGGSTLETRELRTADLIIVISKNEEIELKRRGLANILWSPPSVKPVDLPLSEQVGIVGSANRHNCEGIRWLGKVPPPASLSVRIYGSLAEVVNWAVGKIPTYGDSSMPYRQCGIFLLPTSMGTGVQIKAVEALACGRAIVARTGAMRGIPEGHGAWIEVENPAEMWNQAVLLIRDQNRRVIQGQRARAYYEKHLDQEKIHGELRNAYAEMVRKGKNDQK